MAYGPVVMGYVVMCVRQAMDVKSRSYHHFCSGKAISITYSESVTIALGFQHAKRTRHSLLLFVVCQALHYFSTYLINGTIFEKMLLNTKCVF